MDCCRYGVLVAGGMGEWANLVPLQYLDIVLVALSRLSYFPFLYVRMYSEVACFRREWRSWRDR